MLIFFTDNFDLTLEAVNGLFKEKMKFMAKSRPRRTTMDVNVPKKGAFVLLGKRLERELPYDFCF